MVGPLRLYLRTIIILSLTTWRKINLMVRHDLPGMPSEWEYRGFGNDLFMNWCSKIIELIIWLLPRLLIAKLNNLYTEYEHPPIQATQPIFF